METGNGVATHGTTNGSPTINLKRTGRVGIAVDIGKENRGGMWKNMNLSRHKDNRKLDGKEKVSMHGDLTCGNMRNGKRSSKDNLGFSSRNSSDNKGSLKPTNRGGRNSRESMKFSNLGNSNRDNLRFNSLNKSNNEDNMRLSNHNALNLETNPREEGGRTQKEDVKKPGERLLDTNW